MIQALTSDVIPTTSSPQVPSIGVTNHLLQALYYSIGCVGVLDNTIVLIVMFSSPQMRKSITNLFIINQSFIDLCAASFLIASTTISSNKVPYTGIRAEIYCRWWLNKLPQWSLFVSSTYNLVGMTLERYIAVLHPIWHKVSQRYQYILFKI